MSAVPDRPVIAKLCRWEDRPCRWSMSEGGVPPWAVRKPTCRGKWGQTINPSWVVRRGSVSPNRMDEGPAVASIFSHTLGSASYWRHRGIVFVHTTNAARRCLSISTASLAKRLLRLVLPETQPTTHRYARRDRFSSDHDRHPPASFQSRGAARCRCSSAHAKSCSTD